MVDLADWKRWRGDVPPRRLAHDCPDWDYLPTDESCIEMTSCGCEWEDPELQALAESARKAMHEILDALNVSADRASAVQSE